MRKLIAVVAVVAGAILMVASFYTPVRAAGVGDKCTTMWNKAHTKVMYITCPTEEIDNTDG